MGPAKNFELLLAIAIIGVVAAIAIPLAKDFGYGVLATLGLIVAGYGLVVLLLNMPIIIDWLRQKSRRKISESEKRHDV